MAFQPIYAIRDRHRRGTLLPYKQGIDDGSTLTLDFTKGQLDPRLTFTRSTNATFINSSGLVQYADANMMRNSSWSDPNQVPTSWSGAGNTPTIPDTGSRTFTVTTAATSYIAEGGSSATGSQGVVYTAAVEVTAVSGSPTYNNTILATASPTGVSWYRNGTPVNGTDAVQTGVISYVFTSGSGSFVRVGLGASGGPVTNQSITMTKPRLMPGNRVDSPYFPSASATDPYQAPRFDYDPTSIGTPRGLLIEASAVNRLFQSSAFSTSPWGPSNYTFAGLGYTSPDGVTLAQRWTVDTGSVTPGNVQSCANVTSTSVTLSIWWRNGNHTNSTSNNLRRVAIRNSTTATILLDVSILNPATTPSIGYNTGSSGASLTQYQDGWYRLVMTVSSGITSGNTIQAYVGGLYGSITGAGEFCYWWGAQLEDGSVASSYIPTGASTGNRAADECSMTGTNFSSWFNSSEGTFTVRFQTTYSGQTLLTSYILALDNSGSKRIVYMNTNAETAGCWDGVTLVGGLGDATGVDARVASAYSTTGRAFVLNGGTVLTGSVAAGYSTATSLAIGSNITFAHFRQIKFYPTRLTNAQLQVITT